MRRDHGVPVAAGNLGQKTLAILRVTLLFRRRKDSRARVQRLEGSRELRQGGRLNDNPRLFRRPETPHFHRQRNLQHGLAGTDAVREQGGFLQPSDNAYLLVLPQLDGVGSAGKMLDVGGRELARDEPVEPIVVLVFDEPPGGVVLFQPRLEFVLNGSLLFLRRQRLLGVLHTGRFPVGVVMLVVDLSTFQVQTVADQVNDRRTVHSPTVPRFRRAAVSFNVPLRRTVFAFKSRLLNGYAGKAEMLHKRLVDLGGNPRRADAGVDGVDADTFRLDLPQRLNVFLVGRIVLSACFRHFQLLADIAGKVDVVRFDKPRFRVLEEGFRLEEFGTGCLRAHAEEIPDIPDVDPRPEDTADLDGVLNVFGGCRFLEREYRALGEDVGLGHPLLIDLIRFPLTLPALVRLGDGHTDEALDGRDRGKFDVVLKESVSVLVDRAVVLHVGIIGTIQRVPELADPGVVRIAVHRIDEVKNRFFDADVACRLPYLLRLVGPLGLNQRPVGNGEQAAVLLDKRPFPHPGIRDPLFPFDGNRSPLAEHVCRKRIKSLFQPVLYALPVLRLEGVLVLPVHGPLQGMLAEHHLGMLHEVFVDDRRAVRRLDVFHVAEGIGYWRKAGILLAENQDVGRHLRPGVLLEGRTGKPDRRHKIGLPAPFFTNRGPAHAVHREVRRDLHDQPAGARRVDGAGNEIVVDGLPGVLWALFVRNPEITEGNIGNHKVEGVVPHALRVLEPRHLNVGIRIELAENPPGKRIQFNADETGTAGKTFRHEAEEKPGTRRRLKHPPTTEPELFRHAPHGADDLAVGIVRVERGLFGGVPFLSGHHAAEIGMQRRPVIFLPPRVIRTLLVVGITQRRREPPVKPLFILRGVSVLGVKHFLSERTPSGELCETLLFLRRRVPLFLVQLLKETHSLDVGLGASDVSAGHQYVIGAYMVISTILPSSPSVGGKFSGSSAQSRISSLSSSGISASRSIMSDGHSAVSIISSFASSGVSSISR